MTFDPRWKNPQGKALDPLHRWAEDLIKELRSGRYLENLAGVTTVDWDTLGTATSGFHLQAQGVGVDPVWAGFLQAGTGAVTRTWRTKLREIQLSVTDFGADPTTSNDSTAEIQAAIDAANAFVTASPNRGATVYVPPGTYLVSGTLSMTQSRVGLRGENRYQSVIIRNADYGTTIEVNGGATLEQVYIKSLSLNHDNSSNGMNDAHINALGVTHFDIEDVGIDNGAYGIILNGCVDVSIRRCALVGRYDGVTATQTSIAGILLTHVTSPPVGMVVLPTQIEIADTAVFGPAITGWQYGVIVNACEDIMLSNCYLGNNKNYNLLIEQTSDNQPILEVVVCDGTYIDGAGIDGVLITGAAGNGSAYIGQVKFSGVDIKGNSVGVNGLTVDGTARGGSFSQALRGLQITGCTISAWPKHGLNIDGGNHIVIASCDIKGNNFANALSGVGLRIGATVTDATVVGNRSGGTSEGASPGNQLWGIDIISGALNLNVVGNNLLGNATAALRDNSAAHGSGGQVKNISNNIGYNVVSALIDPGADRIRFWDDSADIETWLTTGVGLAITSTTLDLSVSTVVNSLGADVALNNTANYFTGPTCAQGTSGTWFASGTVTVQDTAGAANIVAKLWDGTTVIDSAIDTVPLTNGFCVITLSGRITTPAGNIRIDVRDITSTSGLIIFNNSGNSKDSTLTVLRIA